MAIARLMSVPALSIASNSERAWPSADSAARIESTRPDWRPTGRDTRVRPLVMFWSAKAKRCLAVSMLPATDASAESENCLCSAASACSDGAIRAVTSTICWVSASNRVGALITRSRNCSNASLLGVELTVGLRRGDDNAGQQVAPLLRGLGHGVVEDLPHVERLRQRGLGIGDRTGERLGLLSAEFLDRQTQFVVAGADGVVDVDDDRLGQVVEGVDWYGGQRVRVGRIHPARRRELRLAPLATTAPSPQPQQQDRQSEHCERHEDAEPRDLRARPRRRRRRVESLGGGDRGPGPVALSQFGFDFVGAQRADVEAAGRGGRRQERIGAVLCRDRENRILRRRYRTAAWFVGSSSTASCPEKVST